jgi:hypothetical protein
VKIIGSSAFGRESQEVTGVGMEEMRGTRGVQATREPPPAVVALRKSSFFRFLTDDDLARLARLGVRRSYAAGDPMVEEGSDRGGLFVILSGTAEVDAGGTVHTLRAGDFFGEMALLARTRRTATVFAVEPVEVMIIETIDYGAFLIENPSVAVTCSKVWLAGWPRPRHLTRPTAPETALRGPRETEVSRSRRPERSGDRAAGRSRRTRRG